MSEGEYGRFDFNGVHVDINSNTTEYDVIASSLHELTHQMLASSTSIGMLDFLLMNIHAAERDVKLRNKIDQLHTRVSNSSIKVQESTAVLVELMMLNSTDEKSYLNTLNMYVAGRTYMKEYGFEKLEFLLKAVNSETHDREKKLLNIANNIRSIAIKAMNVDFYDVNPLDGKYMKCLDSSLCKYNANYRFMKIIRYIENERKSILGEMAEKEINDIFQINDLPVCSAFDWDKFSEWANNMLCKPLGIKDISEYINFVENIEIEEQLCSASAYNSRAIFKKKVLNSEEEVKSSWTHNDILYVHYEESYFMHVLINLEERTQFMFFNKFALTNLATEVKILFMDRNHYEVNISKCPQLIQYDTFVDIGNVDSYAIKFIKDEAVIDYYIKNINNNFCVLFFRGSYNTAFFLMYPLVYVMTLIRTHFNDLVLQDNWWDEFIPEEKLEHFCKFLMVNE